jgi:L-ascorbate metabolism protein UlaG (beta-lactamase superfamily)
VTIELTHVGGPTVLIDLGGWRILADPTFDPPGRRYGFGVGTSSVKTAGPALQEDAIGTPDVVLLSHDHHADNLDDRGRALLPHAGAVLTTASGARRLTTGTGAGRSTAAGGADRLATGTVRGLRAGERTVLRAAGRPPLRVLATPCRHGPPLSRPVVGEVIGFALALGDDPGVALWMTGDTVLHRPLRRVAGRLDVDVALIHCGSVRFPITGPVRYSMNGAEAARLIGLLGPRVAVPVHYEGWSHFSEPESALRARLARQPSVRWLTPGRTERI